MRGTPEEEISKGSMDKYEALQLIHALVDPTFYFEIGVQKGKSIRLAKCPAVGVDPDPRISSEGLFKIYKQSSDEYFYSIFSHHLPADFVFIDGMHLFEQVLRDFIHTEKMIAHKGTVVVIDDIFPAHPAQASRNRRTCKWTGDVWKLLPILMSYRSDLQLTCLDTSPTGMLLVQNLDPENTVLEDNSKCILATYDKDTVPGDWIINRHSARLDVQAAIQEVLCK